MRNLTPRMRQLTPKGVAAPGDDASRLRFRNAARPNWYSTARWQELRRRRLKHDRWICQQTGALLIGRYPSANSPAVDHIVPHNWDPDLFWDFDNLQSVSKEWHDRDKQRIDRRSPR